LEPTLWRFFLWFNVKSVRNSGLRKQYISFRSVRNSITTVVWLMNKNKMTFLLQLNFASQIVFFLVLVVGLLREMLVRVSLALQDGSGAYS